MDRIWLRENKLQPKAYIYVDERVPMLRSMSYSLQKKIRALGIEVEKP